MKENTNHNVSYSTNLLLRELSFSVTLYPSTVCLTNKDKTKIIKNAYIYESADIGYSTVSTQCFGFYSIERFMNIIHTQCLSIYETGLLFHKGSRMLCFARIDFCLREHCFCVTRIQPFVVSFVYVVLFCIAKNSSD